MTLERSPERDAAIRAALPHVPALGWTESALEAGLRDIGEDPMAHLWLFPRGPVSAAEAWADLGDRDMAEAVGDVSVLRIPGRIRRLIATRMEQNEPHKEALRRALSVLALPWNAGVAARTLARTADAMWAAAGDMSADFSWYTRRASLGAIYAATLTYWLSGRETEEALAFLDRRLAGLARLQAPRRAA